MRKEETMGIYETEEKTIGVQRTRSQSIPIKVNPAQSRDEYDDEIESKSSDSAVIYEWATWKMYHRIVSYRQQHPLSHSSSYQPSKYVDFRSFGTAPVPIAKKTTTEKTLRASALPQSSTPQNGEIFEMDL